MNPSSDHCNICGGTEKRLHDGFYYCAECGTQDDRLQETVVEAIIKDGTYGQGNRKRIAKYVKQGPEINMPNSWYLWHSFNFVLFGVANELINLNVGVKPSFRKRLLWVWTRYMKKYMNIDAFGLMKNEDEKENENHSHKESEHDSDGSSECEKPEYVLYKHQKSRSTKIQTLQLKVMLAIIHAALNLDGCQLQDYHLLRLLRESRVSIPTRLKNLIPPEMKPHLLQNHVTFVRAHWRIKKTLDVDVMTLLKDLQLGTPLVPNLRDIVEECLDELCLPYSLKPLIFSIMDFCRIGSIDLIINDIYIAKIPNYRADCLAYILLTLKFCFGLDDDYEVAMSEAVDKINLREKHPRAFITDGDFEQSSRLFSFQQWYDFLQVRNHNLQENCYFVGYRKAIDTDVYVGMEHADNREGGDMKELKDEMTENLINSLPGGELSRSVIPKSEFKPTITPYFSYNKVLVDHLQDPELKKKIGEDFRQYSVDYITKDFHLVDPDSNTGENLIKGVSKKGKIIKEHIQEPLYKTIRNRSKMVYLRNCDNHNWMTTKGPTTKHTIDITPSYPDTNAPDKEPEPKRRKVVENDEVDYVVIEVADESLDMSEIENNTERKKIIDLILSQANNEVDALVDDIKKNENPFDIIEEDEGINIFDDDFLDDTKKEEVDFDDTNIPDCNQDNFNEANENNSLYNNIINEDPADSESSLESLKLNINAFDREMVIKELILHACRKHKITIPMEYREKKHPNERRRVTREYHRTKKYDPKCRNMKVPVLNSYYDHIKQDKLLQISNKVKAAIEEATKPSDIEPTVTSDVENMNQTSEVNNITKTEDSQTFNESMNETNIKDIESSAVENEKLFNESSDEETSGKQFLPEVHPDFDEKVHDPSQLYLKVKKPTDEPEVEVDENLTNIVKKKLDNDRKDPNSLCMVRDERSYSRSDSEEDLPLSDIKRLMNHMKHMKHEPEFEPFMEKKNIPEYNYWFKFNLIYVGMITEPTFNKHFNGVPRKFQYLLNFCASLAGEIPSTMFRKLQKLELMMYEKCGYKIKKTNNIKPTRERKKRKR